MTTKEALMVLDTISEQVTLDRKGHLAVMQAVQVLAKFIEESSPQEEPEKEV